jgi:hypothetical protein
VAEEVWDPGGWVKDLCEFCPGRRDGYEEFVGEGRVVNFFSRGENPGFKTQVLEDVR